MVEIDRFGWEVTMRVTFVLEAKAIVYQAILEFVLDLSLDDILRIKELSGSGGRTRPHPAPFRQFHVVERL